MFKSNTRKQLVLWIPLTPFSKWTGEGIAHTIERIIQSIPPEIKITIVCLSYHKHEIIRNIGSQHNIHFMTIFSARYIPFKQAKIRLLEITFMFLYSFFFYSLFCVVATLYALYIRLIFHKRTLIWCPSWISLYAIFNFNKSKIIHFWDPFVFSFEGFSDAVLRPKRLFDFLNGADIIVTQSIHNQQYLIQALKINPKKIKKIENMNPSYSKLFSKDTLQNINQNKHAILNYWQMPSNDNDKKHIISMSKIKRLLDQLDSNSKIIFISTQERPYKGFHLLMNVLHRLQIKMNFSLRIIKTANLHYFFMTNSYYERFPWCYEYIYCITRVKQYNHALLYLLSDLVIHPSLAEGGVGVYPLYEAASLNRATVMHHGSHVTELLAQLPALSKACVNFNDIDSTAKTIELFLKDAAIRKTMIKAVLERIDNKKNSLDCYIKVFTDHFKD